MFVKLHINTSVTHLLA